MTHPIQQKLITLATQYNLGNLSLRAIGELVGENHPQKIKHHLNQLVNKGLLKYNDSRTLIQKVGPEKDRDLIVIPVLGTADCGPATFYAEQNVQGYLKVSGKLLKYKQGLYALKAVGSSMNRANIQGKNIEEGDYVIIDGKIKKPDNKDYVISIIDGVCNIKKYFFDKENQQVVLFSESTQNFPPIVIHPEETQYMVNGKVIQVVKKPEGLNV